MAVIKAQHLTFSYDGAEAVLSDVSFELESEETVGQIGANSVG